MSMTGGSIRHSRTQITINAVAIQSTTFGITSANKTVTTISAMVVFHLPHLSTQLCGCNNCYSGIQSSIFGITSVLSINQWAEHL